MMMTFFITGLGLSFYCVYYGIGILEGTNLTVMSSPIFYFIMGAGLYFTFMFHNFRSRGLL